MTFVLAERKAKKRDDKALLLAAFIELTTARPGPVLYADSVRSSGAVQSA